MRDPVDTLPCGVYEISIQEVRVRQTVAISLPSELTERIDAAAQEEGVSRSEVVRDAVRAFLAIRDFQRVRAGIVPYAEAAGFVTDEDVFKALS